MSEPQSDGPIPIQDGRELEKKQNGLGIAKPGDPAYTLDTTGAQSVAIAVDTFNQTLSETNQTLRAGTDVDRMGGVLVPVLENGQVMPTLTAKMQGQTGWAPYNETAHLIPHIVQASELRLRGQISEQGTCPTLLANSKQGDNTPLMVAPVIAPTITTCKGSKGGSSSEAIDELIAMHDAQQAISFQPGNLRRQAGADPSTETFPTLKCDSGDQMPHVCHPVIGFSGRDNGADAAVDLCPTLRACNDPKYDRSSGWSAAVASFKWGNSAHAHTIGYSEQNSPTLTAGGGGNMIPAIMHPSEPSQGVDLFNQTLTGDVHVPLRTAQGHGAPAAIAPTLTASNDPSRSPQSSEVTQQVESVHKVTMAVRRLTPRECERLQGFPDDWSRIPWKGKPEEDCPDGPRYKACGNSMAVPVMRWIGERIDAMHKQLYGPKQ